MIGKTATRERAQFMFDYVKEHLDELLVATRAGRSATPMTDPRDEFKTDALTVETSTETETTVTPPADQEDGDEAEPGEANENGGEGGNA
jgi:hypothetical protein